MRIVNKQEMLDLPDGTVFALYTPEIIFMDDFSIKTGSYLRNGKPAWNGELMLSPYFKHDMQDPNKCYTNWSTVDNADVDYDDDQLFVVFSKSEIKQMIACLQWALNNCETEFNQDIWLSDDGTVIMYDDIKKYTT